MARQKEHPAVAAFEALVAIDAICAFSHIRQGWAVVGLFFTGGFVVIAALMLAYARFQARRYRGLEMANIDSMTGQDFEKYVAALLGHQGYQTKLTPSSGDLGVDIVAQKAGISYAVQCKRHSRDIGRTAISDAVAGMAHYRCDQAMVVTNRSFTPGATRLSRSTKCLLIGRDELARWINGYSNGQS